jgi:monovalent cation:H+ antiporter-2, CPA2 family
VVEEPAEIPQTGLKNHAVLIGYGRVGRVIGEELEKRNQPFLVVEELGKIAEELQSRGIEVVSANGALSKVLEAANLKEARWLFVAIPDAFEAGRSSIRRATRMPICRSSPAPIPTPRSIT